MVCVFVCALVLSLQLPSLKLAKRNYLRNVDFSPVVTFINRWLFKIQHKLHGTGFSPSEHFWLCMNSLIFMGLLFCRMEQNDTVSFTIWWHWSEFYELFFSPYVTQINEEFLIVSVWSGALVIYLHVVLCTTVPDTRLWWGKSCSCNGRQGQGWFFPMTLCCVMYLLLFHRQLNGSVAQQSKKQVWKI